MSNISMLNDTESQRSALNVKYNRRQQKMMMSSFNKLDSSIQNISNLNHLDDNQAQFGKPRVSREEENRENISRLSLH